MMETGLPQLLEGLSISLESRKTEQMKYGLWFPCWPGLPTYCFACGDKLSSLGADASFVCSSYKKNKPTNNPRKSVDFFVIVKSLSSETLNF